ncbi:hypothetical protein L208DRAFT_281071 [Tricholoma matsutake]|nr:hypothetical protein L208DRAFT_281071 [Tricholoma matsutake 945]
MSFDIGAFQPFPLSDRTQTTSVDAFESPLLPSRGLELTVRGLETSSGSAAAYLHKIIEELSANGQPLPPHNIVLPSGSSRDSLDYVNFSLSGNIRESPRPDVLQRIRAIFNNVPGITADWKISNGFDKSHQLSFNAEESPNEVVRALKESLNRILQSKGYAVQSCWVPKQGTHLTYHFTDRAVVCALTHEFPLVDGISYPPILPCYIQPIYGLEIAITNVNDIPEACAMIDHYIEHTYGTPGFSDPVVCFSHLELDDSVYTVVVKTPEITNCLLTDPFNAFIDIDLPSNPGKPAYLYILNSKGFPLASFLNHSAFCLHPT